MKGAIVTDTEQSSATPAEASAGYRKTIRVRATPGALFDAITTTAGLAAWWVPRVTGSGSEGGDLEIFMGPPEPLVIHVDEATRPASVQWTVTECSFEPDWVGTRPTFTITAVGNGECELSFRHHGLTSELPCFGICRPSWDHFIAKSLRELVESGHGHPAGSPADLAWRAQMRATRE
jgi:uncharacterized protein YndB with AHSA1/START domain